MNTVSISIYQFTTYSSSTQSDQRNRHKPFSKALHDQINTLMRDKKQELESRNVDTTVFYNHHPETGKTKMLYPLVIYHCIGNQYYLTGINHGAYALEQLAVLYPDTFPTGPNRMGQFKLQTPVSEAEIGITETKRSYKLFEWRPIHHQKRNAFNQMSLVAKAYELNTRLEKHLTNELGKYLNISFEGLKLEITDIDRVYEPVLYKNRHLYPAFDIRFTANIALPPLITLGNHQALGYGRVEPL